MQKLNNYKNIIKNNNNSLTVIITVILYKYVALKERM